jgi:outer membrane lipoprotein-sorting protein
MKSTANIRIIGILVFTIFTVFTASATAQDAAAIVSKMDGVLYAPKDMTGTHTIILVDKNGKEETREANIIQKGTDKRIMRFTAPASQAGIAVLALPDDIMYMYLPAFGKERRIASSVKNQNFAGTDFSYDDMEPKPYAEKYDPELLRTEGDQFVVQLVPKGRSDYSKIIAYINKTAYYPESMEYYDKGNTKVKEATYHFKKAGKYWNSEEIVMTDLKKNHKTIMRVSDVQYDTGLSDDEFTVRRLKQ